MELSQADQKGLIALLDHLLVMAKKASRLGLAVLGTDYSNSEDPWIRKGLMLLLRGTDSANIERTFKNLIQAERHSRAEVFRLRMIMEAMISLCRRDPLEDIEVILFSVIGDLGREDYLEEKKNQRRKKVKFFLKEGVSANSVDTDAGRKLMEFSEKQVEILLDQVNPELLAPFLAGESHSLQCRVLGFLDEEMQSDIVDQLELGFLDLSIEKAQKLISYRIRRIGGEFKDEEVLSQKEVDALLKQKKTTGKAR